MHSPQNLRTIASVIKERMEREFEESLSHRDTNASSLATDDELFRSFVELTTQLTIGQEHYSYVRSIGMRLKKITSEYEEQHRIKVNKRHLYFALSLLSLYCTDTINAMVYWELSQKEEHAVAGAAFNPTTAINQTVVQFSSVVNPVRDDINTNTIYRILKGAHPFIEEFPSLLTKHNTPEVFAYFSAAIRYRQISYWLIEEFTEMTRMYGQELINALCILVEANLKDLGCNGTLGSILNNDLPTLRPAISALVGLSGNRSRPATGLFLALPTGSEADFNTNFPLLVSQLKMVAMPADTVKAYLLYGAYMLRNKSLHDYTTTLIYYNNSPLFFDAIGLLFATVSAVKNL